MNRPNLSGYLGQDWTFEGKPVEAVAATVDGKILVYFKNPEHGKSELVDPDRLRDPQTGQRVIHLPTS